MIFSPHTSRCLTTCLSQKTYVQIHENIKRQKERRLAITHARKSAAHHLTMITSAVLIWRNMLQSVTHKLMEGAMFCRQNSSRWLAHHSVHSVDKLLVHLAKEMKQEKLQILTNWLTREHWPSSRPQGYGIAHGKCCYRKAVGQIDGRPQQGGGHEVEVTLNFMGLWI